MQFAGPSPGTYTPASPSTAALTSIHSAARFHDLETRVHELYLARRAINAEPNEQRRRKLEHEARNVPTVNFEQRTRARLAHLCKYYH